MTGRPAAVSPYLLRHIPRVVNDPKWGGGLSWADLAAVLGGPGRERDRVFAASVWVCRRRGRVEVVSHRGESYVVARVPEVTEAARDLERRAVALVLDVLGGEVVEPGGKER
jgi:hypothetical protein